MALQEPARIHIRYPRRGLGREDSKRGFEGFMHKWTLYCSYSSLI